MKQFSAVMITFDLGAREIGQKNSTFKSIEDVREVHVEVDENV